MKTINICKAALLCWAFISLSACSDFFETDNATVLPGDDYMKEGSEMYSGFIGVITKMQAIGDKAIYLTDTRAEMLEPLGNSSELYQLYNYDIDLQNNTYANPAPYYDVIIACNDYLHKVNEYKATHYYVDEDHFKCMVSGALRVKAWVYFTLGKIYGEAVWFDDPMQSLVDISGYERLDLTAIINKCIDLIDNGMTNTGSLSEVEGINGTHSMRWSEWLLGADDSEGLSGDYALWDKMTPEYFALAAELALWNNNYQRVVDLILPRLNESLEATLSGTRFQWIVGGGSTNDYGSYYSSRTPGQTHYIVSVITYNYEKNQINSLYTHFQGSERKLGVAPIAEERYRDVSFNPGTPKINPYEHYDGRAQYVVKQDGDKWLLNKYRYNKNECPYYIYRTKDLYMMLIEAFNHLGRYDEMEVLLHKGVNNKFPTPNYSTGEGTVSASFPGFSDYWSQTTPRGRRSYPDSGVRGAYGSLLERPLLPADSEENKRHNDLEILKEILLEFPAEGKTYSAMLRMARRYSDYNIIADFVCPKYSAGMQEDIRSKILNGGYFVNWDIEKAVGEK